MTTLSKPDLEQMLNFLDLNTLELLNSHRKQESPYTYGSRPLLKYSVEALTEYASVIYRYILPHFGAITLTEDEYIALWLNPYTILQAELASKADDFIGQLRNITETPTETEPNTLPPMPNRVYAEISDYLGGINDDLYADIIDYMTSTSSPLRRDTVTDQRVLDLIAEVDAMRAIYNQELATFVGVYSIYSTKTEKIVGPNGTERVRYRVLEPKTTYGLELTHLRQFVEDRLAYYNLNSKTVALVTAHKSRIPADDWKIIYEALESKVVTKDVKDLIKASKEAIEQALTTGTPTTSADTKEADIEEVRTLDTTEVFISNFVPQLEQAYSKQMPTTNNATLDDVFADIDAIYNAQSQDTSFCTVQNQQKSTETWFYNYSNISQSLLSVLQIVLNSIVPSTVLSSEALSHGAIKGMLVFAEQIKHLYSTGTRTIGYDKLAEELRHQLREHTTYFTETAPLPELVPMSSVQLIESGTEVLPPTNVVKPSLFDLTPPIQVLLDTIKAATVITETEVVLSVPNAQSLVPVPDYTIKQIAEMLIGQPCIPYLLNGDLMIYVTDTKQYLKPVPQLRADGYVDYVFRAFNWNTLQSHILKLQSMLKNAPDFIKLQNNNKPYIWQPLPKQNTQRRVAFDLAKEHLDSLIADAKDFFEDDEKALKDIDQIAATHYYKDLYISGHRLSAWVYYPDEYRDKISNKPVDANGKRLYYEPNHIDLNRSNNHPDNLKIELKQTNVELRSSSKPVFYQGHPYPTIKKYCDVTGAGNYKNLQQKVGKLKPGDTICYLDREYTRDTDSNQIIATDLHD